MTETAIYTARPACRGCGYLTADPILDLGTIAVSDFPRPDGPPVVYAPLLLQQCAGCGLVQLGHTTDAARLFGEAYWYRSGINETMVAELQDVVRAAEARTPLRRGSVVLDIGANDGTLLGQYVGGVHRVAVEPSDLAKTIEGDVDEVHRCFFPDPDLIAAYRGKVRVVTSIACFYAVDDPHAFLAGVRDLLHPEGVWIVQFQDLAQMLEATAFDNICHEHLIYYSLRTFEDLAQQHDLVIVSAERRAINGGSLRLILQHRSAVDRVSSSVGALQKIEDGCDDWQALSRFGWRIHTQAGQIRAVVQAAGQIGCVDLYGASTKANTLLQVCGLGPERIRQAWERSPAKWGRATITGIPIVEEEAGRQDPPVALLVGIWQFREALLARERSYQAGGGRLIFPLPRVDVVGGR